ncbi:hypothetical protein N7532_002799 [Penicillium argentinense]|uniref:Uncharacterized protein n=1 Tax=Penicillium argentinense TaxID=1131581 RepID=A0A9W9G109_9EURO|nr:uncharacterized protein N7532_002799 [Penicillium argentinense]KAJ5110154.1 hypothetical protein N7532_002799 [Penicillium argentinense]
MPPIYGSVVLDSAFEWYLRQSKAQLQPPILLQDHYAKENPEIVLEERRAGRPSFAVQATAVESKGYCWTSTSDSSEARWKKVSPNIRTSILDVEEDMDDGFLLAYFRNLIYRFGAGLYKETE